MEDVVAAARRIEKILEEQMDSRMECLVSTMQDQIQILKKDLKKPMSRSPPTKPRPHLWPLWLLSPLLPQQPLQPLNRRLPLPLAISTRITARNLHSTVLPADKWIVALHIASSAEKKATSCPTVLPARSFNAFSSNKHGPAPAPRLEDKSWGCCPRRTTPTPTLTCS